MLVYFVGTASFHYLDGPLDLQSEAPLFSCYPKEASEPHKLLIRIPRLKVGFLNTTVSPKDQSPTDLIFLREQRRSSRPGRRSGTSLQLWTSLTLLAVTVL